MRRGKFVLWALLASCVALAAARESSAANWPRFRGPNGTGTAADKDVPVQWTEQSGVLWKAAIPGLGHSSPVVWGKRVYLQSATADGKERLLLCLNADDGKTLWSRSVPGNRAHTHKLNTFASSTPAIDGERVYALFWDGTDMGLYAYDLDGKLVWSRDLGPFKSQHGPGTSPMVYRDKVYVANDQDGAAAVLALEAKTGKVVWQARRRAYRACYAMPFLLEQPGAGPQLIVASTAGITAYDPQTGKVGWHWTFGRDRLRAVASPVAADGLVFANTGNGEGDRHMLAVKAGGTGDVTKTNLAWENKRDFPYVPTLLTSGGHLYYVRDDGNAGCAEAATGKVVWSERLCRKVIASPVLIDGKVYAVSEDEGDVYVFEASPTFKLLAKSTVGESVTATPAVADNRLFIRGRNHLFCIGKPSTNK
jgi:outer membrane protein assembly factor BamB